MNVYVVAWVLVYYKKLFMSSFHVSFQRRNVTKFLITFNALFLGHFFMHSCNMLF